MKKKERIVERKKDKFYAKIAFYLSLGFWVPLFNIGFSVTSIIIAIFALKKYYREPEKYGGIYYIIAALILSIASLVLTTIGLILYLMSEQICQSQLCQLGLKSS